MAKLIQKTSYIKPGKSAGGYAKYIATREKVQKLSGRGPATAAQQQLIQQLLTDFPDSKELFEYEDYRLRPNLGTASAFITMALDCNVQNFQESDVYMKYIATRPSVEKKGDHGLFGRENDVSLPAAISELNAHEGNVWTIIYSLRREDASRLEYDNADTWRQLLLNHEAKLAQAMNIAPTNFRWYAAFHDADEHPHIHLMIWSQDPNEGFLSPDGIEIMRSKLTNTIFKDEMTQLYGEKDLAYKQLRDTARASIERLVSALSVSVSDDEALTQKMCILAEALKDVSGRKTYGYLKPAMKEMVDDVVDQLAKNPKVTECYESWNKLQDTIYGYYSSEPRVRLPLSQQKEFRNIKNIIIAEAENIRLGNHSFEDDLLQDEPELAFPSAPDIKYEGGTGQKRANHKQAPRSIYEQASDYRKAKEIVCDPEASYDDKDVALDKLKKLWAEGYTIAAYALGKFYRDGVHILQDTEQAKGWFLKAAVAGNEYAQYALGKMLLEKEPVTALQWLEIAANQGNQFAQYTLGKMYLTGDIVKKDIAKALEHLEASANRGNQFAQYTLGKLFLSGTEVHMDREQARMWFEKAAAQGNEYARFFLEHIHDFRPPSVMLSTTKLLHHMSRIFQQNTSIPSGNKGIQIDTKRRQKLQEKRIALGHNEKDHEDPALNFQNYQMM